MRSSTKLVLQQIEGSLASRNAAPFATKNRSTEGVPFGIDAIDAIVPNGIPLGAITELVGPESSGRTTVAHAFIAGLTRLDNVCAWIDASDTLSPESVAANGIDLERLLWVRCGTGVHAGPQRMLEATQSVSLPPAAAQPRHTGGGSPHPRSEARDMPAAIGAMLAAHGGLYDKQVRREKKSIGTPGMPNRPLSMRSEDREEQVNSDRLPPRRGENLAIMSRRSELLPRGVAKAPVQEMPRGKASTNSKPWRALDQAIRATDLLLQGAGFSAIVLDLGSVAPEFAWRIPMATWFRFRAACERSRTTLVLLTQHPCARSSALVVRLHAGDLQAEGNVMTGTRYRAEAERSRFQQAQPRVVSIRKPPQSERPGQWMSKAQWVQAK